MSPTLTADDRLRKWARALVDKAWNECTESGTVPATNWADRIIDSVPLPPPEPTKELPDGDGLDELLGIMPQAEVAAAWEWFCKTHILPHRLLLLATGGEEHTEETRKHLVNCAICRRAHETYGVVTEENSRLREVLDETVNHIGRNVVCVYPDCGCDGNRNCDAINGPSLRATEQNIEGKINPAAAIADSPPGNWRRATPGGGDERKSFGQQRWEWQGDRIQELTAELTALRAQLAEAERRLAPPSLAQPSVRCFKAVTPIEYWAFAEGGLVRYFAPQKHLIQRMSHRTPDELAGMRDVSEITCAQLLAELEATWPEGAKELRKLGIATTANGAGITEGSLDAARPN